MDLDLEELKVSLPELLGDWLPRQRWFGSKGRRITSCTVTDAVVVSDSDPGLVQTVVRLEYAAGSGDHYSVPLGLRAFPVDHLEHTLIGQVLDRYVYDAPHDRELMSGLLRRIDAGEPVGGLRFTRLATEPMDTTLPSRPMTAEQSNTSVVYADAYILKLFRRLAAGINPELEVTRALAEVGSTHVVAPLGYVEADLEGEAATLGLLQPFLRSATDGWAMAETSVRDLFAEADLHADEVGGDFAGESERLGIATAQVHVDLARALPVDVVDTAGSARLAASMHGRLAAAANDVPALEPYVKDIAAAYEVVAQRSSPLPLQRIHGDYHLGQVLRTDSGWVLLDFEGEPARPLAERRAMDSPLRDVAGMLRSFEYAARHLLADHPGDSQLAYRATEWAERNRDAFCAGYISGGGTDPRQEELLLRAFELDKAVYEVVYEARNRPSWLEIPMGSIERLVG